MAQEKNTVIRYNDSTINLWSDEKKDYFDLTEIANAVKGNRKTIKSWLKKEQTLEFIRVWERKNNTNFIDKNWDIVKERAKDSNTSLSIKFLIEETNAIGIFTEQNKKGTRAHKDIAIKFAAYVSPELELFLIEEVQRLKEVEKDIQSLDYLNRDQILYLVQLKEVFKYVMNQEVIQDAHKEVYASKSNSKYPFADFHKWRNVVLDLDPRVIDARIKRYCIENDISLTDKLLKGTKKEKLLLLDTYDTVRDAVWDFLLIKGMDEVQALSMANLAGDMIRAERGEVLRANETDLFHTRQDLGKFSDFAKKVPLMAEIKTARQLLALRAEEQRKLQNPSSFNEKLMIALQYNPNPEKGTNKNPKKKNPDQTELF